MDDTVKRVVRECTQASDEERVTFGDVVGLLIGAGVERYHADLILSNKTYYLPDGEAETVPAIPTRGSAAEAFSAENVKAAIRAAQAGQIRYREFCTRVAAAGCVGYHVFLEGQRVVYYGRSGVLHVEMFPTSK